MRDGAAIKLDGAGIGFDQTHDHGEDRGLACAIGPEQANGLAAPYGNGHIAHHDPLAKTLGEAVGDQPSGLVETRLGLRIGHCEVKIPVTRPFWPLVKVETLVARLTTSSSELTVPPSLTTITLPVRRSN